MFGNVGAALAATLFAGVFGSEPPAGHSLSGLRKTRDGRLVVGFNTKTGKPMVEATRLRRKNAKVRRSLSGRLVRRAFV